MVRSIETRKLFGAKDWRAELNRFHTLGVRTLQPVHQLDNRFGGAALHNVCGVTASGFTLGFDVDAQCRNVKGLTADFNGFIQQTWPRFGPNGACSAGFQAEADAQAHQQELEAPGRLVVHLQVAPAQRGASESFRGASCRSRNATMRSSRGPPSFFRAMRCDG